MYGYIILNGSEHYLTYLREFLYIFNIFFFILFIINVYFAMFRLLLRRIINYYNNLYLLIGSGN